MTTVQRIFNGKMHTREARQQQQQVKRERKVEKEREGKKFNLPRVHVDGSFYTHVALHKQTYTVRFVRGGSYSRFTERKLKGQLNTPDVSE